MALNAIMESLHGLLEGQRGLYERRNGAYVLALDGIDDHPAVKKLKSAHERQKTENQSLREERDALKQAAARFGNLDANAARAALARLGELEDAKLLDEGKVEELLARKTKRLGTDFEKKVAAKDKIISELQAAMEAREAEITDFRLLAAIRDEALRAGARKGALDDIVNRARSVFQVGQGEGPPTGLGSWMTALTAEAAHLFEPNAGAGATGGDAGQAPRAIFGAGEHNVIGQNLQKFAAGEARIQ